MLQVFVGESVQTAGQVRHTPGVSSCSWKHRQQSKVGHVLEILSRNNLALKEFSDGISYLRISFQMVLMKIKLIQGWLQTTQWLFGLFQNLYVFFGRF